MTIMSQGQVDALKLHRRIRTGLVARLNDTFRSGGNEKLMMLTESVAVLPGADQIIAHVQEFDDFSDPHNEHNVGYFDWQGEKLVWKIDCYDYNGVWMSWVDPQTKDCVRALTIMRADEF